jgi:GNAT superfamily N-acetyltransferase
MPSAQVLERFIATVESNRHAEAIEEFYAEDASMQENEQPPRRGRDGLVAGERKVLARMKSVKSRCIRPVFVEGDKVVIRWVFEFETGDGGHIRMEELAHQRWEGDRIAEEKFFYDPKQLVPALFTTSRYRATELKDAARLQRFLEANPEYYLTVFGVPPSSSEGQEEIDSRPPPQFRYDRVVVMGFDDASGNLAGMASVTINLLADNVGHIGLFIVATDLHGSGAAREMYEGLERWLLAGGARWLRLGVVAGNAKGGRFWEKHGFVEVRRRLGVQMGPRVHDLRVMIKPARGSVVEYLALVERDRPESP